MSSLKQKIVFWNQIAKIVVVFEVPHGTFLFDSLFIQILLGSKPHSLHHTSCWNCAISSSSWNKSSNAWTEYLKFFFISGSSNEYLADCWWIDDDDDEKDPFLFCKMGRWKETEVVVVEFKAEVSGTASSLKWNESSKSPAAVEAPANKKNDGGRCGSMRNVPKRSMRWWKGDDDGEELFPKWASVVGSSCCCWTSIVLFSSSFCCLFCFICSWWEEDGNKACWCCSRRWIVMVAFLFLVEEYKGKRGRRKILWGGE